MKIIERLNIKNGFFVKNEENTSFFDDPNRAEKIVSSFGSFGFEKSFTATELVCHAINDFSGNKNDLKFEEFSNFVIKNF